MNRKQLKNFLDMIDECDRLISRQANVINWDLISQGMQDAIVAVAIQRKNNLIEQLSNRGIHLDESV